MNPRIFVGIYPAGIVYCDKGRERHGDYVRLAFLPFDTLELDPAPDAPADLLAEVRADAATYKKGDALQTSTCGQSIILGRRVS